jgi:CheY-like chemotaxis protein
MEFFMHSNENAIAPRRTRRKHQPRIEQTLAKKLSGNILVVDDSSDGRAVISGVLRCIGFTVETAKNGLEACEQALAASSKGQPFDLIMMDMQMPVMDGYAATTRLRELGYSHRIAALKASSYEGVPEECLPAGCDDFATKPITFEMLSDLAKRNLPSGFTTRSATAGPTTPVSRSRPASEPLCV